MGDEWDSRSWVEDDFVDTPSTAPPEHDPWETSAAPTPTPRALLPEQLSFEFPATRPDQTNDEHSDDFADEMEFGYTDDRWSDGDFDATSDWAAPEPTIEASSQLSESLYPPDRSVTDFSRDFKIGEFLAHIDPITEEQRNRCHAFLISLRVGRLRRWIPWLRNRDWSGAQLLLFLEFRRYWESSANTRWWEAFRWDGYSQAWVPSYDPRNMTLEHSSQLLEYRRQFDIADVINPIWFAEWEVCAPWELGVRSFASFALFRAAIAEGDDWQVPLSRQDQRSHLEKAQCADQSYAPFMLPSYTQHTDTPRAQAATASERYDVAHVIRSLARAYSDRLLS